MRTSLPGAKPALLLLLCFIFLCGTALAAPNDLDMVKQTGTLRHLGVAYANFVTGLGDGLDVELMQLFAKRLGVKYEYVSTNWDDVLTDLTGVTFELKGNDFKITGKTQSETSSPTG